VTGLFMPISEIIPERRWEEPTTDGLPKRFYRVRQW
jgi:hypothetical protein